ncbi:LysE family translocator [Amycolatopsis sp. NPDC059657]|uniref:LysE family translocator n=1 Tax=Amycolatopsis sp. NPDC059657 TaxID=3346899 RepID=UPI00366F5AA6
MGEILWLGLLLGGGAALSVGPIFVTILQEAATRGFGAAFRVILGSAVADLILLIPALAFAWVITAIAGASLWVGIAGAIFFLFLAGQAIRDARRLWRHGEPEAASGWAFWKGVVANLANPLTWTFWLATGTPTMLRAHELGGWPGLVVFTVVWFVVASGLEAVVALVVARSGKRFGGRGQAMLTALSAVLFVSLAGVLLARDVFA